MPQWVVQKYRTRRFASFDDIERTRDTQSRNTVCFQMSGDQTHGLMADGSHRYQKCDIDRLGDELCVQFGDRLFAHAALGIHATHTREKIGR